MTVIRNALKASLAGMLFAGLLSSPAAAQDKPAELKIAITTFLSGPASVFGVPGKTAAEMIAEDINKKGGILGVPVKLSFIDEGAGGEALVSNYRRIVQDEKVDVDLRLDLVRQLQPARAARRRPQGPEPDVGLRRVVDPRGEEVPLQLPHAGERHAGDDGGPHLPSQEEARLQDHRGRQPGLCLGPRELGDLLDRAEAAEARRPGRRRVLPEVRRA